MKPKRLSVLSYPRPSASSAVKTLLFTPASPEHARGNTPGLNRFQGVVSVRYGLAGLAALRACISASNRVATALTALKTTFALLVASAAAASLPAALASW